MKQRLLVTKRVSEVREKDIVPRYSSRCRETFCEKADSITYE